MEGEVCQHSKFGFCKYQESCSKIHFTEICKSLSGCHKIKECKKRHPKPCKRFDSENGCRFQKKCEYNHQVTKQTKEQNELTDKVNMLETSLLDLTNKVVNMENERKEYLEKFQKLEKVVAALCRKVPTMEKEIKEMKSNRTVGTTNEEKYLSVMIKDKEIETEQVVFDINDIKEKSSTPKEKSNKVSDINDKEALLSCKECNYKCKKINSLKKHITIKHEQHPCKEFRENLPTFTELLKHIAKNHCEEEGDVLSKDDEIPERDLGE